MVNLLIGFANKKITLNWCRSLFHVEKLNFSSGANLFCSPKEKTPFLVNGCEVEKKRKSDETIPNIVPSSSDGIFSSANYLLRGFESD